MRLCSISVFGFRGLRDSGFTMDSERAFILYGLNGTGKSSLFRALQFALTGDLPPIPESDVPVEEVYRHVALSDSEAATVEVILTDDSGDHTVRRELEAGGAVDPQCSTRGSANLLGDPATRLCFLTRREFARMIEAAERERWNRLSPLLGHQELADYRDGLRRVSLSLRDDLDIRRLEGEANELGSRLERVRERYQRRLQELELEEFSVAVLCTELEGLIREDAEAARDEIDTLEDTSQLSDLEWEVLRDSLGGSEQLTMMSQRLSVVNQQLDLVTFDFVDDSEFENVLDLLERFSTDRELAHGVLHEDFFGQARIVVDSYDRDPCPVCGLVPDDWESVRNSLDEKREELIEVAEEYGEVQRTVSSELASIRGVLDDLQTYDDDHEDLEGLIPVRDKLRRFRDFLELADNQLESSPPGGIGEEVRDAFADSRLSSLQVRDSTIAAVEEERAAVSEEIERLGESPHRVRLSNLEAMADVYADLQTSSERLEHVSAELEAANSLIEEIREFFHEVEESEGQLSTELLEVVEDRVGEIFRQMTDNPSLEPCINRFEERGVVKAEIIIDNFHGLGERPAREFLSESNRHALGLAIYFASMEYRSPLLEVLVMDDITHSTDARHRRGLAKFLFEDLSENHQLVLMTHDREWYNQLRNLFEQSDACYEKLLRWEIAGVKTRGDDWQSLRDQAHSQVMNQEAGAGNTLRMALEEFIQDLGTRYKVLVPLRRHPDELNFEMKRNALVCRLREVNQQGNGIIDPDSAEIRAFANSQQIANLASHYPTEQQLSGTALRDALRDFEAFAELFICGNQVGGHRCGWALNTIRNLGQGPFECPQCQRPYGL